MPSKRFAVILSALVMLAGCTQGRTFVLSHPHAGAVHHGVAIRPLDAAVKVDPKADAEFRSKLSENLKKELKTEVTQEADLIVEYRFTLFEQGNTAARVGSGVASLAGSPFYGIGDGSVGVEVVFARPDGTELGHIVTDGSIAGAFGSTSSALGDAAGAIAKYTKMNFSCPVCGQVGVKAPETSAVQGLKSM
jgi:hypothetical protein